MICYFKNRGIFAEVVSDDEYNLVLKLGYAKDKLIYNGPIKSKHTFLQAIKNGCIVNIDTEREISWLKSLCNTGQKFEVGIRVNFDLEAYCPKETLMGDAGSRFGFCYENGELLKALNNLKAFNNVKVAGLHFHYGTKTRSLNVYQAIARMACRIKSEYDLDLKYVDVGGGFYHSMSGKPSYMDYIRVISGELSQAFDVTKTKLIVEPGVSLVGTPISFVSSVIDINQTIANYFVITDGSRINIDPLMNKKQYIYTIKYMDNTRKTMPTQVISGFTCIEKDRLFLLSNHPQLKVGDQIIYNRVGAYTMSLSPLFIKFYPAVYVKNNNKIIKVRKKWTSDEYIQKSRFEMLE